MVALCSPTRASLLSGRNHHAPKEWIEKYKGQFDDGWDKLREGTLARQEAMGIIPKTLNWRPSQATQKTGKLPMHGVSIL
ncbi:MAG: arylsulfatase A-like enzyme [Candidatus Krumholzibacteriia bacterium]|jgi:arylsulfatase A-like enzyme